MRVQLKDFTMAFDDVGSGLPVLFIHGYPLSRRLWDPQIAGLAGQARLIAPDLRGHGESSIPETKPQAGATPGTTDAYPMELIADDCAALLEALQIDRPIVLCGLSMGGYIAFAFQRKYPERVGGLILAATRPGPDTPEGKAARETAARTALKQGPAAVVEGMLPKLLAPETYSRQPELVQQAQAMMLSISTEAMVGDLLGMKARSDSTPQLSSLRRPVLILHGDRDQLIPLQEAEAMQATIPGSRLEILPAAGHLLNLEQPVLFNAAVSRFLREL